MAKPHKQKHSTSNLTHYLPYWRIHKLRHNKLSNCKYTAIYTHNEHNQQTILFHILLLFYITKMAQNKKTTHIHTTKCFVQPSTAITFIHQPCPCFTYMTNMLWATMMSLYMRTIMHDNNKSTCCQLQNNISVRVWQWTKRMSQWVISFAWGQSLTRVVQKKTAQSFACVNFWTICHRIQLYASSLCSIAKGGYTSALSRMVCHRINSNTQLHSCRRVFLISLSCQTGHLTHLI